MQQHNKEYMIKEEKKILNIVIDKFNHMSKDEIVEFMQYKEYVITKIVSGNVLQFNHI